MQAKLHAAFLSLLLVFFKLKWVICRMLNQRDSTWRIYLYQNHLSIQVTLGDTERKVFSSPSLLVLQTHWTQWLKEGPEARCNRIIKGSSCSKNVVFEVHTSDSKEREEEHQAVTGKWGKSGWVPGSVSLRKLYQPQELLSPESQPPLQ